jgi:hypothetical protein
VRNGVPVKTILGDVSQTGQSEIKYNKLDSGEKASVVQGMFEQSFIA